jgi:hypothetical protein
VTVRKVKATPVRSISPTPTESSVRALVYEPAAQDHNGGQTSPSTHESGREHNHTVIRKHPGLGCISASDMATGRGTSEAACDKELGRIQFPIHPKASSQLLGSQNYESSHNSESRGDETTRSVRGRGSSSTLRSFYDSQKIPLAVSQQTSNSSARDFALRKGCPPVVAIEKPVSRSSRSQKNQDATQKSTKRTSSIRLDLSMLFPKPSAYHGHLLSSQLGRRRTEVPEQLIMPPAVPLGPSTSQKHRLKKANPKKPPHRFRQSKEPAPSLNSPDSSTVNMRKPDSVIKNRSDNLGDQDLEDFDLHEIVEFRTPTNFSRNTQPPVSVKPAELKARDHSPYSMSRHDKECDPRSRSNEPHSQIPTATEPMTVSPAREQLRLTLQNWEFRSKHHRTLPARNSTPDFWKSRSSPLDKADLHKESVLWLSSSDDESEADASLYSNIGTTIPGIRDSLILTPSDSSGVEIGTAYAIKTKRLKIEKEIMESPLKTVQVPERQSSKMFSFLSDQSRTLPNTQEGSLATSPTTATSSERVGNCLRSSTTVSQKHDSFIRLMTVTPQEESLLEAIRSKRATMRQNITEETYGRTSEEEQGKSTRPHPRPQTSGFGGNSTSFLHLSRDVVPTLSAFHNHRRSISAGEVLEFNGMEPRNSCSTDPITSHRGSLAHSSLPSASSQETPMTPSLESVPDNSPRRTSSNTKRYSILPTNYQRHSRVRTGSSAVIVLDSLDDDSSSHFKMDELPIWASNSWPDPPGLAVVL